ncbi:hypothetical protein GUJ93_ZPchr0001g30655 [Zizania palustris]|uniref:Uncharacterized protein n=1 Tax=Zizania palustris TaxID=103762 RepID=A0A8J5VS22_ZIZPA|nr:hypothetical protein GUJ93_ZPchr0001g30655 [Zizania palustris]
MSGCDAAGRTGWDAGGSEAWAGADGGAPDIADTRLWDLWDCFLGTPTQEEIKCMNPHSMYMEEVHAKME